ncbi:transposase, partial [Streptomyces sp. NPDC059506]|uniref:transposase n=1 Tax=Streptomyces sp. NPDC059506 TaxID=3347751 RepID=UPI00368F0E1F
AAPPPAPRAAPPAPPDPPRPPPHPPGGGSAARPFADHRHIVEGLTHRYRTGIPWRDPPREAFEPCRTVRKRPAGGRLTAPGTRRSPN